MGSFSHVTDEIALVAARRLANWGGRPSTARKSAIERDWIDFRVRHSHRLDHVLHRRGQFKPVLEGHETAGWREKIVQFCVKPKCGVSHSWRNCAAPLVVRLLGGVGGFTSSFDSFPLQANKF